MRYLDDCFDPVGVYGRRLLFHNGPEADPTLKKYVLYVYEFTPGGQNKAFVNIKFKDEFPGKRIFFFGFQRSNYYI